MILSVPILFTICVWQSDKDRNLFHRYRGFDSSCTVSAERTMWMLPALLRNQTDLPPPFTGPLRRSRSAFPTTVTVNSLCTLPADVSASRSNAASAGTCTVTPPPEVSSFTVSDIGEGRVALIDPPEVEP